MVLRRKRPRRFHSHRRAFANLAAAAAEIVVRPFRAHDALRKNSAIPARGPIAPRSKRSGGSNTAEAPAAIRHSAVFATGHAGRADIVHCRFRIYRSDGPKAWHEKR